MKHFFVLPVAAGIPFQAERVLETAESGKVEEQGSYLEKTCPRSDPVEERLESDVDGLDP